MSHLLYLLMVLRGKSAGSSIRASRRSTLTIMAEAATLEAGKAASEGANRNHTGEDTGSRSLRTAEANTLAAKDIMTRCRRQKASRRLIKKKTVTV